MWSLAIYVARTLQNPRIVGVSNTQHTKMPRTRLGRSQQFEHGQDTVEAIL